MDQNSALANSVLANSALADSDLANSTMANRTLADQTVANGTVADCYLADGTMADGIDSDCAVVAGFDPRASAASASRTQVLVGNRGIKVRIGLSHDLGLRCMGVDVWQSHTEC